MSKKDIQGAILYALLCPELRIRVYNSEFLEQILPTLFRTNDNTEVNNQVQVGTYRLGMLTVSGESFAPSRHVSQP